MPLNAQNDIASRIEDAVFELMGTTPVQAIKVTDVLRLAHTSKSTFYRCYRSVDDVVKRMEILQRNRSKVLALNSENGDPVFTHKATVFMHEYFRDRLRSTFSDETDLDLYLAFALAGHHNLIQYWLEVRPDLEARTVAAALNRMFYAPLFVDDASRHWHPRIPDFEKPLG